MCILTQLCAQTQTLTKEAVAPDGLVCVSMSRLFGASETKHVGKFTSLSRPNFSPISMYTDTDTHTPFRPLSHTEAFSPRGGDGSQVFPHGLDDAAAPHPQASADAYTTVKQQPDGSGSILHDTALVIDHPQRHQGPNGITAKVRK